MIKITTSPSPTGVTTPSAETTATSVLFDTNVTPSFCASGILYDSASLIVIEVSPVIKGGFVTVDVVVTVVPVLVVRNCGTIEDIEECVADIFIAIFSSLQSEKTYNGDLKCLVATIAKRSSIDLFRRLSLKNKRTIPIDELEAKLTPFHDELEHTSERKELKGILLDCVNELGDPDSSIIINHYYYGRSSVEIASDLKMTTSSVQKRIQRARKN